MSITFIFIFFRPSLSGTLSLLNPLAAAATCIRTSCIPVVVGLLVGACASGVPIGHVVPKALAVIHVFEVFDWVGRCWRTGLPEFLLLLAIILLLPIFRTKLLLPKVIVLHDPSSASSSAPSSVARTATSPSIIGTLALLLIWWLKQGLEMFLWWRLVSGCGRCL